MEVCLSKKGTGFELVMHNIDYVWLAGLPANGRKADKIQINSDLLYQVIEYSLLWWY